MHAKWLIPAFAFAVAAGAATRAHADEVDIEVPVLVLDIGGGEIEEGDSEIDLANVVQTAAKGVTTVQEAPAIVTVVTAEDIQERGMTTVEEVIDYVPGWLRLDAVHNQFAFGITRGAVFSMLYMHNGVSMFNPWNNIPAVHNVTPIESIKRIEFITGPGGVLWGANSFMGIVNVVTKDAEDVDGVEAYAGYGDGPGMRSLVRGYVMAGIPELFSDRVSLFVHAGFQNYKGPKWSMPQHVFSTPLPFPNSQLVYGPLTTGDPPRSTIFNLDGKVSIGALNITAQYPFVQRNLPLGFPGVVSQQDVGDEDWDLNGDGQPDCSFVEPYLPNGQPNPDAFRQDDRCIDRGHIGGRNRVDNFDRYIMADWRTRFADGKAGATLKGYLVQFDRGFEALNIMAPSMLLEGGLSFHFKEQDYRTGVIIDADYELPQNVRLLYGAEAFYEWIPDTTTNSRQGPGIQSNVLSPYDFGRTPLLCPREPVPDADPADRQSQFVAHCPLTMIFQVDRTVLGAYANPQWRPNRRLILDGGVRLQAAPDALSGAPYPLQAIFSGAAVYELAKDWHLKLNYAEGFRPPVFNNTHSNGQSINIDGSRTLEVENSRSGQGELNARLYKGSRRLREINFRADYSYTKLENLIQLVGGRYYNTADRGIHSAEFLGKVFLKGGHRVELGYTWLKVATADIGYVRAMPEHWFNLSGVFNLISDKLQATTTLKVLGAMEDPNRIIEFRTLDPNPPDGVVIDENKIVSQPYELVLDRLPPSAELIVGLTWQDAFGIDKLQGTVFAYNAFNNRRYQPDVFHNYEPRLEFPPNPYPDFSFVSSLSYAY